MNSFRSICAHVLILKVPVINSNLNDLKSIESNYFHYSMKWRCILWNFMFFESMRLVYIIMPACLYSLSILVDQQFKLRRCMSMFCFCSMYEASCFYSFGIDFNNIFHFFFFVNIRSFDALCFSSKFNIFFHSISFSLKWSMNNEQRTYIRKGNIVLSKQWFTQWLWTTCKGLAYTEFSEKMI